MSTGPGMVPPKPIPLKDRASVLFVERGRLDVLDGAFVVVDKNGTRTHIPIGGLVCLMLEPGARVSHAAVTLAARVGTLLLWVGEAGVRLYSAGQPGGARADRLLHQARMALDPSARLKIVRKMYSMRFGEPAPLRRSVEQLRGIEGARVKRMYQLLAQQHGVKWRGRSYDPGDGPSGTSRTVASAKRRPASMGWRKPLSSPQGMRPRSVSCIPASRDRSCSTLPTYTSSRPSCRLP